MSEGDTGKELFVSIDWGPTGVIQLPPHTIKKVTREYLTAVVKTANRKPADLEAFFEDLNTAIRFYKGFKRLRQETRPQAVRQNLKRARDHSARLMQSLNDLDGKSRQIISGMNEQSEFSRLLESAGQNWELLSRAYRRAQMGPRQRSGRLVEGELDNLAADVADAIKSRLKCKLGAAREGLFHSVLQIVLKEATGIARSPTQALLRRAINNPTKSRNSEGLIEYGNRSSTKEATRKTIK